VETILIAHLFEFTCNLAYKVALADDSCTSCYS